MIKAMIFDFDGLIVDTELSAYQTWQDIYQEHDSHLPFETWATCIGGAAHTFDACAYLEEQIGRPVAREELRLRRKQRHVAVVGLQPALPGVEDYILGAKRLGLKVAAASSSRHEWVDGHLSRLDLLQYFDCIKCADDVTYTKPNPELYQAVLDTLGVRGSEAIAFEDSPNGVRAAQGAGIFCIAVPNVVTRQLSLEHADLRLISMAELPLEQLLLEVEKRVSA